MECTIDLGSLVDWVTAIATIGAVIVALYLSRREERRLDQRLNDELDIRASRQIAKIRLPLAAVNGALDSYEQALQSADQTRVFISPSAFTLYIELYQERLAEELDDAICLPKPLVCKVYELVAHCNMTKDLIEHRVTKGETVLVHSPLACEEILDVVRRAKSLAADALNEVAKHAGEAS